MASPSKRLSTNVDGDFFVDATCIDCGTCRWMAPGTFDRKEDLSRVHTQPKSPEATRAALKALVSCPTASIGTLERKHDVRSVAAGFPDRIADHVYHCGYHHEDSFGAASYLVVRSEGNVLVDSPRLSAPLLRGIEALGGVKWMFLTHRDDVAEHAALAQHFGCQRVMHRADVTRATRAVEVQLTGTEPIAVAPDLTVIPVPGHTRGSSCLLYDDRFLFTGDHLAWSIPLARVYAFRDACWYDWNIQIESMKRLAEFSFEYILPGHSAPCNFAPPAMKQHMRGCIEWMQPH